MEKTRHLKAPGKGAFLYDYKYDILTFKIKDRDYKMSVEFQNFVVDIDKENFITGIRIFDASKVSGMDKLVLKNMKRGEFRASIQNNVITVRLNFVGILRNKLIPFIPFFSEKENFTQQFTAPLGIKQKIEDSEVIVPNIAA